MDPAHEPLYRGMGPSPPPPRPPGASFSLLYRAHVAFVRHVVRFAGVRDADAADVVQEVFLILHREITRGLDTSRSLRGWLKRTSFRRARDHRELAMNREQPHEDEVDMADTSLGPEESAQVIDTQENVLAVLDALPHEQRLVLVMHDAEEMPMSEIADVLERPIGTCYTRLHAARKAFTRAWDERRASGLAAAAPFALWDARSLLATEKVVPESPAGFEDEVWRRLVDALGPGIAGAGAAAAGGALAAGAAKGGVVLTAKQIALGAVLSALTGAGLHAAVSATRATPALPAVVSATHDEVKGAGLASASPIASASVALPPPATSISSAKPATSVVVAPHHNEANDRLLLDAARAALERGDLATARGALARIKSPRFAAERDELKRIVLSYQDGGSR